MRSDREELPEGFTKEEADRAETREYELQQRQSAAARGPAPGPGCQQYWPTDKWVCGAIRDKYNSLGAQFSFLLWPTSDELTSPDGHGKFTTFQNGPIYWSAAGGAHPVVNSILNRWGVHQYETGWLKYPISDEILLPDGGRRQEFENGAIYVAVQNAVGSAIKNGPIRDKWNTVGGTAPGGSLLGYVTGDEIPLPDGQGRMARFQNGVIYWSPTTGAYVVRGEVLDLWAATSYEAGVWGYPIADQVDGPSDRITQQFQDGEMEITTFFTGTTEWLPAAGGPTKFCQHKGRSDRPHFSQSFIGGVQVKDTASVHTWWVPIQDCKDDQKANIAAQFQTKSPDGTWVDRGDVFMRENLRPGPGSSQWLPVNEKCQGFGPKTWRAKIDVDLVDTNDPPGYFTGIEWEFKCS